MTYLDRTHSLIQNLDLIALGNYTTNARAEEAIKAYRNDRYEENMHVCKVAMITIAALTAFSSLAISGIVGCFIAFTIAIPMTLAERITLLHKNLELVMQEELNPANQILLGLVEQINERKKHKENTLINQLSNISPLPNISSIDELRKILNKKIATYNEAQEEKKFLETLARLANIPPTIFKPSRYEDLHKSCLRYIKPNPQNQDYLRLELDVGSIVAWR